MPNVINELALAEVTAVVEGSTALILIDPTGLKADESLKLRKALHQAGAQMKIAKASLVRRAIPADVAEIVSGGGSLALVGGEDIAAAAKLLKDLEKEEKVTIRGGLIEGNALDASSAQKLADLPSREQLYGMLCNVLAAPLVGTVRVLNEVPTSLVRVLQAIKDKQS
ncbi:MAG: 50S ribosomal protein L10 [Planctomycetes bacterium]|nr:50S ribosomal protein L10 [Planctomycetota bacterium]